MKMKLIAVGKIKEDWLKRGISEYIKRISRFCEVQIVEIPDSPESNDIEKGIAAEGGKMLSAIKENDFVIALDLKGEILDSENFSKKFVKFFDEGKANITVLIGGSNGYSLEAIQRADASLCLSKLTFPHQLARLIFLEQAFRAFKIAGGEKYHK